MYCLRKIHSCTPRDTQLDSDTRNGMLLCAWLFWCPNRENMTLRRVFGWWRRVSQLLNKLCMQIACGCMGWRGFPYFLQCSLWEQGSLRTSFHLPHNFPRSPGLFAVIRIVYQGRVVGFIFDSTATWETGSLLRDVQPKGENKWVDIIELVMCLMDQGSCWQTQIPWLNLLWLTFLLDPLTPGWLKDFIRRNDTGL